MSGLKGLKVGVIAIAALAAIVSGLVFAAQVSGQDDTVSIGDGTAAPGESGTVDLEALGIGDPGLGAWTIDITYDTAVVSVDDCAPAAGGVCNPAFGEDTIRVTGASATGLEGDTSLATITFTCADEEASTDLTISINVFADATIGDPQDIDATISDGSFTCEVPAPADPTATVVAVPDVGDGTGTSGGSSLLWVVALLAAIGAAGVLGFGALRVRARA